MQSVPLPSRHTATAPVPRSLEDWVRQTRARPTLNDLVERLHIRLINDEEYLNLIDGVYNEQAVEGSLVVDDVRCAEKIREEAVAAGDDVVARQKLATIIRAFRTVLRRYGMGRNQRRTMFTENDPRPSPAPANGDANDIGDISN